MIRAGPGEVMGCDWSVMTQVWAWGNVVMDIKGEWQHHIKRYAGEGLAGGHGAVPEMGSGAWDLKQWVCAVGKRFLAEDSFLVERRGG